MPWRGYKEGGIGKKKEERGPVTKVMAKNPRGGRRRTKTRERRPEELLKSLSFVGVVADPPPPPASALLFFLFAKANGKRERGNS